MSAPGSWAVLHGPGAPPFAADPRKHCNPRNADEFFSPDEERGPQREAREHRAKTICRHCPLRQACRTWSITARIPYGTWGGLTEKERAAEIARRNPAVYDRREPCGTDSARRRHLARAQVCTVCRVSVGPPPTSKPKRSAA